MTTDEFIRRNQVIADYLAIVGEHCASVEADGLDHPGFRDLLGAQQRMLNAVEKYLSRSQISLDQWWPEALQHWEAGRRAPSLRPLLIKAAHVEQI
jgi:hypothetical protein